MLRDGLGKVLFIGPAFTTKWMGYTVAKSNVSMDAMHRNGFRLAREEDMDTLSDYDKKRVADGRMKYKEVEVKAQPAAPPPAPSVPVSMEPPILAAPIDINEESEGKYPAKRQRRKRIIKTEAHAD